VLNLLHLSIVAQIAANGISSDIRVGFYGVEIFENDFLIYSGSATEAGRWHKNPAKRRCN